MLLVEQRISGKSKIIELRGRYWELRNKIRGI
jgi:hypothetical protein